MGLVNTMSFSSTKVNNFAIPNQLSAVVAYTRIISTHNQLGYICQKNQLGYVRSICVPYHRRAREVSKERQHNQAHARGAEEEREQSNVTAEVR